MSDDSRVKALTLATLARRLEGEAVGDPEITIRGVASLERAGEGEVCVVLRPSSAERMTSSRAAAFVVSRSVRGEGRNLIRVSDPRLALIRLLEIFHPEVHPEPGVETGAFVSPEAQLGEGVYVAAGARIEAGAILERSVQVHAGSVVGRDARIGEESILYPHVTLYPGTVVGRRVRVHSGVVLGSPGFGYHRDADGRYQPIPQVGRVEVADDVEIGANSVVDRATLEETRIGAGTRIDNLVQIGHNSSIGRDCCLVAQVGVSGSVEIGDGSMLSGQVGIADHVKLAPGTTVGAQSGVARDLGAGEWIGYPALRASLARRVYGLLPRLPELVAEVRRLRHRCDELERELEQLRQES